MSSQRLCLCTQRKKLTGFAHRLAAQKKKEKVKLLITKNIVIKTKDIRRLIIVMCFNS